MSRDFGRAAVRRQLIGGLLAVLAVGCAPSPSAQPEPTPPRLARLTSSPPPPVRERRLTTFADAASALDGARAEALAETRAQREYAVALRLLQEGRLDEANLRLAGLLRSRDKDTAARARALAFGLLTEGTVSQVLEVMAREDRAFVEALSRAHSAERWSSSVRAARQPLRIHSGDIVFVDVAINGTPARLMLDTGADLTCIGSRLAERLGLRALPGRMKVQGAFGDRVDVGLAVVDVDIGGAHVGDHPVWLVDSSHFEPLSEAGVLMIEGVVGWNTIRRLRITMDRDAKTLAIGRSRAVAGGRGDFFWVGKPVVKVQSGNGLVMNFVLDTGTTRSRISRTLAVEAGLGEGRAGSIPLLALGGSRTVQGAVHGDAVLYVGGARMILPTLWAGPPSTQPYGPGDGMLGADALATGRIVIDFPSGEFSISPSRRDSR
jgi:predicted aspartyl protease